jgi:hypothetical protein
MEKEDYGVGISEMKKEVKRGYWEMKRLIVDYIYIYIYIYNIYVCMHEDSIMKHTKHYLKRG